MKSDNKTIQAISAQAHGEAADNRLLRKKLREKDDLISDLRTQIDCLNRNLSEKVSQIADMMDKLVAFMMGRGDVTLSDSLRDAVISGVRAEYEMREKKLKEEYARQLDKMSAEFAARLAAKQNEINALKGEDGGTDGNAPSTTLPDGAKTVGPEEMAAGIGKRMDICVFYSLKIIKKSFFLLLNGSIMTAYQGIQEQGGDSELP